MSNKPWLFRPCAAAVACWISLPSLLSVVVDDGPHPQANPSPFCSSLDGCSASKLISAIVPACVATSCLSGKPARRGKSLQIAVSKKYRLMALHHHFSHNMGGKRMKAAFDKNIALDQKIKWEIRKKRSWRFSNVVSPECLDQAVAGGHGLHLSIKSTT